MVTIAAWFVVLTVFGSVALAIAVAVFVLIGWLRDRRAWSAPSILMHELIAPMGELQDPQYLDRRRGRDSSANDAHDTAVAVIGIGVKPFANRAPLSVPRSERSLRHG